MKEKFLTLYDYGSGGVWQYIYAESEEQVLNKYSRLVIVKHKPDVFEVRIVAGVPLREYDIDDDPDEIMKNFQ